MEAESTQRRSSATQLDLALVWRLGSGDRAAHAELRDRFGPALHGFAASRLAGDDELAEEIMVQTLVDTVRNIHRFDPRRSTLSAWIYGIARRQIQAERRKQRRKKSVPPSVQISLDELGEFANGSDMAEDLVARLDAQRKASELASVLSDREMEVLILHFVDELSVKEIGRIVGRSHRAVDSLLQRAKKKAREGLAKDVE